MLSKNEIVELEVRLSSTWWNSPPLCKVYLDDQVIMQSGSIDKLHTIIFKGPLSEGEHSIKIVRYNKNPLIETQIEDGKIIKDQLLNIDGISIDGIDLGFVTYTHGEFTNSTTEERSKEVLNLGFNGTWELKFSVPTYMWLLEKL